MPQRAAARDASTARELRPRPARLGSFGLAAGLLTALVAILAGLPASPPPARADAAEGPAIYLPQLSLGARRGPPLPTWTPRPLTATPSPTATATLGPTQTPSPSATRPPSPGLPACERTTGDAGGFRFSLDGGVTLAPGARRLDNVAYTWAIDIDPRDPSTILELHQGALYRSTDAGCRFERLPGVPEGGWDQLARAPSAPDLWVLASVFESRLAWTEDAGARWTVEDLPDDVQALAIAPSDPWRWTFAGRQPALYTRGAAGEKFEIRPLRVEGVESLVSAAQAPAAPERWIVGSSLRGLFRTEDAGLTWQPASEGLFGELGEPAEPVTALVPSWLGFAPSDPERVYAVVNRVARSDSERAIWRSEDGGRSWRRRVGPEDVARISQLQINGGTRVFVDPRDPERAFFALGVAFGGFGTDLFRSTDGLASLALSHFDDFYGVYTMGFGPAGSEAVFVGASSNIPSAAR